MFGRARFDRVRFDGPTTAYTPPVESDARTWTRVHVDEIEDDAAPAPVRVTIEDL